MLARGVGCAGLVKEYVTSTGTVRALKGVDFQRRPTTCCRLLAVLGLEHRAGHRPTSCPGASSSGWRSRPP
jgi:hypothetical protein